MKLIASLAAPGCGNCPGTHRQTDRLKTAGVAPSSKAQGDYIRDA